MTDTHLEETPEMVAFVRAIRENPHDEALRLVYSDWLEEHGFPSAVIEPFRKGRITLTGIDHLAIGCLNGCRFTPGSWAKRFVRDMSYISISIGSVTPRQYAALWRQVWRYRRQIANDRVKWEAERLHGQGAPKAKVRYVTRMLPGIELEELPAP